MDATQRIAGSLAMDARRALQDDKPEPLSRIIAWLKSQGRIADRERIQSALESPALESTWLDDLLTASESIVR